jgi:hypothetical protein
MFGSNILDIAIGVMFVYLVLSLVCTAIQEGIATSINKRGKNLFEGVKNLLNDPEFTGLAQQLYNHGLIDGLSRGASGQGRAKRQPSYISASTFSLALVDILGARGVVAAAHGDLLAAAERADDDCEEARQAAAAKPDDDALKKALEVASGARDQRQAALTAAATQAKAASDQAARAASGSADAAPATAAGRAKDAADTAGAAIKILNARRAAVASANNPKDAALMKAAADTLEQALAAGRTLAAQCPDPLGTVKAAVCRLPEGHTKESLLVLIDKTKREVSAVDLQLEAFERTLQDWFNNAMARVSGWYKRWTQLILLGLAVLVVAATNADTIALVQRLVKNDGLRSALVTAAEDAAKTSAASDPNLKIVTDKAINLQLPLGWSDEEELNRLSGACSQSDAAPCNRWSPWFLKMVGLALSVFAISLGAPFWFDTLSKFANVRGAGAAPDVSKDGGRTVFKESAQGTRPTP